MTIRIGANPIGWSNDDMQELGGWISLEECLTDAKAAGFEGMELGNKFPRESTKLRPILEKHGLALIGGWHSIFLIERDAETDERCAAAETTDVEMADAMMHLYDFRQRRERLIAAIARHRRASSRPSSSTAPSRRS